MIVSSDCFWKTDGHVSVFIRNGTSVKCLNGYDWMLDWYRKLLSIFDLELSEFTDVCAAE